MDVFNISTTAQVDSDLEVTFWRNLWTALKIATVLVSIGGLMGNYLSYKAADFMPRSNSSVLMKYLALWDSVAVVNLGIVPYVAEFMGISIGEANVSRRFQNYSKNQEKENFCMKFELFTPTRKVMNHFKYYFLLGFFRVRLF